MTELLLGSYNGDGIGSTWFQCPQKDDSLIGCFKILYCNDGLGTAGPDCPNLLDLGPCHRPWAGCNWVPVSPSAWALDGRHSAQNFVPHLQKKLPTINYGLLIENCISYFISSFLSKKFEVHIFHCIAGYLMTCPDQLSLKIVKTQNFHPNISSHST